MKKDSFADFVPVRAPDILARKNSDGSVAILRLDNDQHFFVIDGLAAEVWNGINGKSSLGSITKRIAAQHKPPVARFEADTRKLIKSLQKARLID
jgi:hypothetical protein